MLLSLGANPNSKNSNGNSLLHRFVNCIDQVPNSAFEKVVRYYGADIHIKNRHGRTPFQCLIEDAFKTADALMLLSLGANPNSKNSNGNSLLHRFVNNIDQVPDSAFTKVVRTYGADIHVRNRHDKTPLACLMSGSFKPADAMLLIELGANPATQNPNGKTLLQIFIKNKNIVPNVLIDRLIKIISGGPLRPVNPDYLKKEVEVNVTESKPTPPPPVNPEYSSNEVNTTQSKPTSSVQVEESKPTGMQYFEVESVYPALSNSKTTNASHAEVELDDLLKWPNREFTDAPIVKFQVTSAAPKSPLRQLSQFAENENNPAISSNIASQNLKPM
jgi:ankyrin repeat protein